MRRKADVVRPSPPPDGLAIGAMIKNEGRYLREWIEFHLLQGVRRFYLYDDGSTDDSLQVLAPYVADGRVRVIPWRSFIWPINSQKLAHAHAIGNVDPDIGWLGLFDVDEFLFSPSRRRVADVLTDYAPYDDLIVPRHEFGSGGHRNRPSGLVTESYLKVSPQEQHTYKSVFRPWAVTDAGVHRQRTAGKTLRLDRDGSADLRLNHYFSKSVAEFEEKLARGYTWKVRRESTLQSKTALMTRLDANGVDERSILVWVDELKERMAVREQIGASSETLVMSDYVATASAGQAPAEILTSTRSF